MDRPYIFCHMMMSLDGKIMGSYMNTPEGTAAGDVFYKQLTSCSFKKPPEIYHSLFFFHSTT